MKENINQNVYFNKPIVGVPLHFLNTNVDRQWFPN